MKKFIGLLLLCLFFAEYSVPANAVIAEQKKPAGYITLNKSINKEVEPNKASISFAVENTADNAKKAVDDNNAVSNKIIEALKLITTPEQDLIRTNNFDVRPNYDTNNGKRVIRNYTAVNSITVDTKDINKIPELINKAVTNGANRTSSLSYSYENDKSVCNDLYPTMIKELKDQADAIAKAAGTSIDGVRQINVSCGSDFSMSNRFYSMKAADMAYGEAALSTPVEPGKVRIRVNVNADFYVK